MTDETTKKTELSLEDKNACWKDTMTRFGSGELSEAQVVSALTDLVGKEKLSPGLSDFGYNLIQDKPGKPREVYLSRQDYDQYRRFQIKMNIAQNELAKTKKALTAETWRIAESHGYMGLDEPQITVSGKLVPTSVINDNLRGKETDIETGDYPVITEMERARIKVLLKDMREANNAIEDIAIKIEEWVYGMAGEDKYDYTGDWPIKITEERRMMHDDKKKR